MNELLRIAIMRARTAPPAPKRAPWCPPPRPWATPTIIDISDDTAIWRILNSLPSRPTMRNILRVTAAVYGLKVEEITGPRRFSQFSEPRQVGMAVARLMTGNSFAQIGSVFGGRDHTTVFYAYQKYKEAITSGLAALGIAPWQPSSSEKASREGYALWTDEQDRELRRMWPSGLHPNAIGLALGRTSGAVRRRASTIGLSARPRRP